MHKILYEDFLYSNAESLAASRVLSSCEKKNQLTLRPNIDTFKMQNIWGEGTSQRVRKCHKPLDKISLCRD